MGYTALSQRYNLSKCTIANTTVLQASWDEERLEYEVVLRSDRTGSSSIWTTNILVNAQLKLSQAAIRDDATTRLRVEPQVSNFQVYGINEMNLEQYWQSKPSSYYGVLVHNFPNFFMMLGPSSWCARSDVKTVVAVQSKYNAKLIAHVRQQCQGVRYALQVNSAARLAHGESTSNEGLQKPSKLERSSAWRVLQSGTKSPIALKQPVMSHFDTFVGDHMSDLTLTQSLTLSRTVSRRSVDMGGHEFYVNEKGHQVHYNP